MIHSLIAWIQEIIISWGSLGVFLGSFIEEIIAFIPSAFVQTASGFFLFADTPLTLDYLLKLFLYVGVPASLGVTLGAIPLFLISKHGGEKMIQKYGKYFGALPSILDKFSYKEEKSSFSLWGIIFSRSLPFLPSVVICVGSGLLKVKMRVYLLGTFLGTLVRATIYGFAGWQLGRAYTVVAEKSGHLEKYGLVVLLISIFFMCHFYFKKK